MDKLNNDLLKVNPKVDSKIVQAILELQSKLPESARPIQGSDYRIAPPLGGETFSWNRRGKASELSPKSID